MKLSVIGAGAMGSAIVEGLLSKGHEVVVYNRTREKAQALQKFGAETAASPLAAVQNVDAVVVAVSQISGFTDLFAETGVRDCFPGLKVLLITVLSPSELERQVRELSSLGLRVSAAVVATYPQEVRQASSEFLLGAHAGDFPFWAPILEPLGKLHDVGPIANTAKVYMACSLIYMFQTIAVAYGVAAFERLGLAQTVTRSILEENTTMRVAGANVLIPEMMTRKYGNQVFSVHNFIDMAEHAIAFARELKFPTSVLELIEDLYRTTAQSGLGDRNVTAIYEQFVQ